MSLRKQAVHGVFWTFTQQISVQLISFVVQIVLARILLPSEFGLIGMIMVFIAIGGSLVDSGMTSSLIHKADAGQLDYSTVFWMNLIFSVLVYAIVFFCSPLIADFFKQPILSSLLRLYAVTFIIQAFMSVQTTRLTKDMRFKVQMMMQIPSVVVGGIVGVTLAKMGWGVWSLVWMYLTQTTIFTIQHWVFAGWSPSFIIDKRLLRSHFLYGYKLTFSGLLDQVYTYAYNIIIGKFFLVSELGYYTQASKLRMLPISNITSALNKVTFPVFSKIQNDNERLKEAYKKLMLQVIFLVAPIMILLVLEARPIFSLLLTEKWLPAVPYFQLLCVSGILYPFHTYNLNILKVKGRTDLFFKLEIIKKIIITAGIVIAVFFGIYGLLYFQVINSVLALWINMHYSGKLIDYSGWQQLKDLVPIIALAIFIGLVLGLITHYQILPVYRLSNFMQILIVSTLYLGLYLGINFFVKSQAIIEFKQIILRK
ncbi:lipopolysaccharide biosynthesis protein [Niabella yanshanensis]|uniref:Lipopolysaccharide biosynthesis protein n=1 Tax=Niabella yanshanensis TaxID=577386 RepID=A0ABZ0WAJ6_9BACT|nr:lipopolysaccharide biosynthesis protein [Niabella yanshanensis]WQD39101.1 lipopolysaccharide biosynthesis protein [Niabella yanshanensis]